MQVSKLLDGWRESQWMGCLSKSILGDATEV